MAEQKTKTEFEIPEGALERLAGIHHNHLRYIEEKLFVEISTSENKIIVQGEKTAVGRAQRLVKQMADLIAQGHTFTKNEFKSAIRLIQTDTSLSLKEFLIESKIAISPHRIVFPKSLNQQRYVQAILNHDIVFGIGPAGTGKTYLAVAAAVSALNQGRVRRMVVARPAVEAGEKLGFLPGTIAEKVDPYLRPIYDALYDLLDPDKTRAYLEKGIIEVAPLAFMRGRTLNDSFIILDEAQNTTSEQMKMFLTRLGFNSKAVITGDDTQIDLPGKSGLIEVQKTLAGIESISFIRMTDQDVVRHPLVQTIIQAYEIYGKKSNARKRQQ